jgi:UDP:flavonoid glycosyltransferase YjiC (YdhE family)
MADLINKFRREILCLPPLHTRQAIHLMIDECVPYTYCWSPSIVSKPIDWPNHINISGYFFLDTTISKLYQPSKELAQFLGFNSSSKTSITTPLIYVGFGSITGNDSHRLFRLIMDALKKANYRVLLAGFETETEPMSDRIFRVGNIPHDWLFQHGNIQYRMR